MRVPEIRPLTPQRCTVLAPKNKHSFPILSEAIYLDTETSHNYNDKDRSGAGWVYQWAFRFCREFGFGRKPSELMAALKKIEEVNKLSVDDVHCIIFIHNSSYDLQYLKEFFFREYGTESFKMLAAGNHHFITFEIGPWIIRCSYKLANRSLAKWGKDLGIKDRKRTGLIDYDVRRYQDTKLTKRDWVYMFYDCIALEECVLEEMRVAGDNLNTIPLTSTGYVRRDTRKIFSRKKKAREEFRKTRLYKDSYGDCRMAFAGGLTHGNRFYAGKTVRVEEIRKLPGFEDVTGIRHRDFRSHYPSQIRFSDRCPRGKWELLYEWRPNLKPFTWDRLDIIKKDYCCLVAAIVGPMTLRDGVTLPYAQESKFALAAREDYEALVVDNGRLVKTAGHTTVTLTELDWDIIRRQYDFEATIISVRISKAGTYPDYLMETTDQYYFGKYEFKRRKNQLKAEKAASALIQDADASLTKSKNRLNGIYGMTATDPVRLTFAMDPNTGRWSQTELTGAVIEEALDKFYEKRSSCLSYQHGIYVTALARDELVSFVELVGYDHFLYADTDSIFYLSTPEIERKIGQRNRELYEEALRRHAYIEVDGKIVSYNAFDDEEEDIRAFRFLHAKAYAYETADGELHCTIAGVAARDSKGYTREQELGSIDELKNGKVFRRCGGTTVVYLEQPIRTLQVDGHEIEAASAAILMRVNKTLKDAMHKDEDVYPEEVPNGEAIEEHYILR